jgi:hypothetical protein
MFPPASHEGEAPFPYPSAPKPLNLVAEPLLKSVIEWPKDKTVSDVMAGGSGDHFKNEGTLAGFSMIGEAKKITVRTLLMAGTARLRVMRG